MSTKPRKPSRSADVAAKINAHLKRFEADPQINAPRAQASGTRPYFNAGARASGGRIRVIYISYQGTNILTISEAEAYLAWLDAGNVGRHFEQQRAAKREAAT